MSQNFESLIIPYFLPSSFNRRFCNGHVHDHQVLWQLGRIQVQMKLEQFHTWHTTPMKVGKWLVYNIADFFQVFFLPPPDFTGDLDSTILSSYSETLVVSYGFSLIGMSMCGSALACLQHITSE